MTTAMLKDEAKSRGFNIVMYGHTHRPSIDMSDPEVTVINPGSLAYPRQEGRRPTYIVMTFCFFFYEVSGGKEYPFWVFCLLFLTHPIFACQWFFQLQNAEVSFSIFLIAVSLILVFRWIKEGKIGYLVPALVFMIPVVREALDAAVREKDYPVVFIRNAREPLQPFLAQTAYLRSYQPVNLVKNRVIASFAGKLEQDLKEKKLPRTSLCGLVLSGHMDEKRVRAVMPGLEHFLEGYGGTMEILFHPGRALPEEIGEEFTKKGFVDFHLSNGRKVEGKALIALTTGKEL